MAVDDNAALPLYVETPEHHAGGEKKGIARIVSDMIAGDVEMQKHLPGRSTSKRRQAGRRRRRLRWETRAEN